MDAENFMEIRVMWISFMAALIVDYLHIFPYCFIIMVSGILSTAGLIINMIPIIQYMGFSTSFRCQVLVLTTSCYALFPVNIGL